MKKIMILAVTLMVLLGVSGKAFALNARKVGPTINDPTPRPAPVSNLVAKYPSII